MEIQSKCSNTYFLSYTLSITYTLDWHQPQADV